MRHITDVSHLRETCFVLGELVVRCSVYIHVAGQLIQDEAIQQLSSEDIQHQEKVFVRGLVKFICAAAYHF